MTPPTDLSTDDILWTDIRSRTAPSGNPPTFTDGYLLRGQPEPVMTATELLLGALGTGGAITVLVQILRDWVARYRIKALSVRLPDGTDIHIADASIDSVERLFAAIGADRPHETAPTPIAAPDVPDHADDQAGPTTPE